MQRTHKAPDPLEHKRICHKGIIRVAKMVDDQWHIWEFRCDCHSDKVPDGLVERDWFFKHNGKFKDYLLSRDSDIVQNTLDRYPQALIHPESGRKIYGKQIQKLLQEALAGMDMPPF